MQKERLLSLIDEFSKEVENFGNSKGCSMLEMLLVMTFLIKAGVHAVSRQVLGHEINHRKVERFIDTTYKKMKSPQSADEVLEYLSGFANILFEGLSNVQEQLEEGDKK
ncbi:MAG: hypothetical protein ACPLKS_06675 [Caldisericum exile]|uniref:hypothetical protein n=1 Tax=Caldisericum exile TaxID=693075 RepID=UPI003C71711F